MKNISSPRHPRVTALSAKLSSCAAAIAIFLSAAPSAADTLQAISLLPGYVAKPIQLGVPFGGAIAQNPQDENILYVSAGNYGAHTLLEVNVNTGVNRTISPVIGNIGGLAVLNNGDLAITENLTSETILRARDVDGDGAYFSPGEITELLTPILVDSTFTGAQLAVAPADNRAAIPAGSLLVQTADGAGLSEILIIENPETAPAWYPAGASWFSGFTYNGGIAFTDYGDVLCGISEFPVGRITALVNTNENNRIDAGETRDIVGPDVLENSISDLSSAAYGVTAVVENSGTVRTFNIPENPLTDALPTVGVLAETNATYLSSARFNFPNRSFGQYVGDPVATLYVGGYVTFPAATNLLAISPTTPPASAKEWQLFY
jgi:hypothetical protein